MIQRMQSVWLILAASAAFLTIKFSFYSGNVINDNQQKQFEYLNATTSIFILVLTALLGAGALIAVFLYKDRKVQLRVVIAAMLVSILSIVLYFYQVKRFAEGSYDLTAVLSIVVPVFLFLAARGIYKDEKLVKSLDRLR